MQFILFIIRSAVLLKINNFLLTFRFLNSFRTLLVGNEMLIEFFNETCEKACLIIFNNCFVKQIKLLFLYASVDRCLLHG